ncbi:MAG: response regulator transcription factor [Natronospirillum sp.]
MTITVLLADDQPVIRAGLTMILNAQPDIEVIAQASDGAEAVALARQHRPDVCLMDIRMPILDGIEATRQLAGSNVTDPIPVVIITTFDLDEYVYGALKAGARGFLLKDAGAELVSQAVQAAARGDALIAPSITKRLLHKFASTDTPERTAQPGDPLTRREEQVLSAVAQGLTNQEIAESLHLSLSTIKTHVASLMQKLWVRNRVELAIWAYQTKRVNPP